MIFVRSLLLLVFMAALFLTPAVPAATAATTQADAQNNSTAKAVFPQQRIVKGFTLTLYAPQVRSWNEFKHFTSAIAFSLTPAEQEDLKYGTATVTGDTIVDMDKRIVTIRSPKVTDVTFKETVPASYTAAVMTRLPESRSKCQLDHFLAYVADEVFLPQAAPAGFNTSPPPILVRSTPAALLFVNGAPVPSAVPNTGLEVIVNANWPLYRHAAGGGTYYLLARDCWLIVRHAGKWLEGGDIVAAGFQQPSIRRRVRGGPQGRAIEEVHGRRTSSCIRRSSH